MKVRGWAIPWYREEDWASWRAICPDFQPDYKKWLELAEAGFKQQQALGHFPEKVVLDPDEFLEWSRVQHRRRDGQARSMYAISIESVPAPRPGRRSAVARLPRLKMP